MLATLKFTSMKNIFLVLCCTIQVGLGLAQSNDSISIALSLIDLSYTPDEIDSLRIDVQNAKRIYEQFHGITTTNDMAYSLIFSPPLNPKRISPLQKKMNWKLDDHTKLPQNRADLAFYTIYQLASLIKTKQISSVELTKFFIDRLKKHGNDLECVITITDSLALAQARRADDELKRGIYRGPLHGMPYGAKDILAAKGYKTTWGAAPFKDQSFDYNATVVEKLEQAGAVLIAKLTTGALAYGDVWYGGKTRNPWNLSEGSSGSSSGPASATVAGLVPFAIGSETVGSIVSPSTRCGATGLRPTFGRVSRQGAMTLSWTFDKLGPICRNAIDCALILDIIKGEDGQDLSVKNHPYNYDYSKGTKGLRVGILRGDFRSGTGNYKNDSTLISLLTSKGIKMVDKQLPSDIPTSILRCIVNAEAAAAFDDLTRSNRDSLMVRQMRSAWPNIFRASRLIPAVEYIQANRLRTQLIVQFNKMMEDIDVLIAPSFGIQLLMTNLTGHPCVVLPDGTYTGSNPGTITLVGNHFDEASILMFARYIQELTPYEDEHPPLFKN